MTKVKIEEKSEEIRARSCVFGLLSLVYRQEPTEEFLEQFRRPEFKYALNDLGAELGEGFWARPARPQLREELALEYTRLFIGPGRHISPHESVHRRGEGQLWGQSTAKVKGLVESWGLKYASDFKGLPDHISVELEFMRWLLEAEADALEKADEAALEKVLRLKRHFVNEHISKWIPQWTEKVAEEAKLDFYRKLAILTKEFVLSEAERLNETS